MTEATVVTEPEPTAANRAVRGAIEWVVIIGGALLVAFVVKTFLMQAFFIPSESMVPQLNVHDRVLVNKVSYHLHDIHRGDIVVFKRPPNEVGASAIKDLIKRVVGLPGDTVEGRNSHVYINGRLLDEPYLRPSVITDDFSPRRVPAGHYFVMGDNRGNSTDARVFGPIPRSLIVGRAFVRVWPVTNLSLL